MSGCNANRLIIDVEMVSEMELAFCLFDYKSVGTIRTDYEKDALQRLSVEARNMKAGHIGLHCPVCNHPLFLKRSPGKDDHFFAYHYSLAKSYEKIAMAGFKLPVGVNSTECCEFRTYEGQKTPNSEIYQREGAKHKEAVEHLYQSLVNDNTASDVKKESRIKAGGGWRQPDVQAVINGVLTAFEFQMSWLTAEVISEREDFYQRNGMRLIWLYCDDCEYREFVDDSGELQENVSVYKTSSVTINRISVGSYITTYNLGALSLTYSTQEPTSNGFRALAQAQPFFRVKDDLYLLQDYLGRPQYIVPHKATPVSLNDLYFEDGCPLPIWWKFTSVKTITEYISKQKNRSGFDIREEVTAEYVEQLKEVLNFSTPPPEWFFIFYQLLTSKPFSLEHLVGDL